MGGLVRIDANNRYGTIFVTSSCASYFGELKDARVLTHGHISHMRFIWDLYEIWCDWEVIDHVRVSNCFRLWGTVIHDLQATSKARNWEHLRSRKWLDELAQLYLVTILFWTLCMDRCYIFLMMFTVSMFIIYGLLSDLWQSLGVVLDAFLGLHLIWIPHEFREPTDKNRICQVFPHLTSHFRIHWIRHNHFQHPVNIQWIQVIWSGCVNLACSGHRAEAMAVLPSMSRSVTSQRSSSSLVSTWQRNWVVVICGFSSWYIHHSSLIHRWILSIIRKYSSDEQWNTAETTIR